MPAKASLVRGSTHSACGYLCVSSACPPHRTARRRRASQVEAFARLGELIFYQPVGSEPPPQAPSLYITQLIPAVARWRAGGMRLRLDAAGPGAAHPDEPATMRVTVEATAAASGAYASLWLRVPSWADAPRAELNGQAVAGHTSASPLVNGTYLRVTRRWRSEDTVALSLPLRLSLEPLRDARPRYAKLAAIRFGPVVLACIGCRETKVRASRDALISMLTPVPRAARTQLRSFRRAVARGAPDGTIVLDADDRLWVREGAMPAPAFRHRRRGATDVSVAATFRETAGLAAGDNLVSFEPFSRPGCCLAAPAKGAGGGAQEEQRQQLLLHCASSEQPLSEAQQRACSWKRHDPLLSAAHGSFHSYESLIQPGSFMSTYGATVSAGAPTPRSSHGDRPALGELKPLCLVPKPQATSRAEDHPMRPSAYALESAFEEVVPEAEYPLASFWLRPTASASSRSALLYPLNEVVDERYSVYFDLG